MKWQGVYTALVTPFDARGKVDEPALQALVEAQIAAGITGLVPMGTTGESPTLSHEEHLEVIGKVVKWTAGRVPVIAGTGSNSTDEALMLTRRAKDLGASASLQVVPYYNRPNQEGLYRHFLALAEQVDLPMIIYNIPGRSGKNLETDTLMRLAVHPHVVGVKEASGDLGQMMEVLARRPSGFSVLSGDDNLAFPLAALGGDGVISVVSHLIPQAMVELCRLTIAGDLATARALHFRWLPVMKAMFLDTNPIPVKTALALQGKMQETFRLPMCPMDEAKRQQLTRVLREAGLL
ncbi:MAG: 4-hydroxy-tetrahydrodipicolinate synthase [Spirochaetales bacterium]